jgi:hypothetical protein
MPELRQPMALKPVEIRIGPNDGQRGVLEVTWRHD